MVIAIDGPAGAGKSTVARAVAERLGYTYLDTGAMYRCIALLATERIGEEPAALADAATIELGERVRLNGRDVTDAIRTAEVAEAASEVSADIGVRMALVRKQQEILRQGDWVAEGRDITTVVAPRAPVRVLLTADEDARLARRTAELHGDAAASAPTGSTGTVPASTGSLPTVPVTAAAPATASTAPTPPTDPAALEGELERVRAQGWAESVGER